MKEESVVTGGLFEVFSESNPKEVLALIFEITTNTMTQEGYALWVQLQQDWLRISSDGLIIRPAKQEAVTESQFSNIAESWIKQNASSRAWVIKHVRQTPMIYSLDKEILNAEELASIPSPVFELGSVKMAVPAGRFLVSKNGTEE